MTEYAFSTSPDLIIGANSSAKAGDRAATLGISHALLVCDPDIERLGLLDQATAGLTAAGVRFSVYSDVQADPPEQVVLTAAEKARSAGCDGVIGLGGGSSMDTAKLVAALLPDTQPLSTMYGVDQIQGERAPLMQIPTTAGTGSEVTMVAIVTTGGTTKAGVVSRALLADTVILDPILTIGLPAAVTAATGIDAMVHAIEAYTSARLKNPLSDMLAREALRLMAPNLPKVVAQGDNRPAREAMLLGAMLAGQAFANAPVAAVHALAYPLGGHYHIPHGLSNSLVLPHVLRFNAPAAASLYAELAPLVLPTSAGLTADQAAIELAAYFEQLASDLGLPTRLRDAGVAEGDLALLADDAMLQQRLLINNPRALERADALTIYQQAW